MEQRALGRQGLAVSALGLGTMGMTMAYGPSDEGESVATIRRAYELGVTFFDTAELYGLGTGANEELLGRAVKGFRDEIVLATKFGFDLSGSGPVGTGRNSRPDHIRQVAENSLRYLQTDRIDLLYQHRIDPDVPIEDVAGAVKELVDAGKVRYFGLSEAGTDDIRRAHAVHPVSALQTEYSIFERDVEAAILPAVRDLGIGFVAYSPLGRGFLTADVRPAGEYPEGDMRRRDERWQGDNYEANVRVLGLLNELAESKGITIAQLALAWLLAQGPDVVPIPGTRRPTRLAENVAAADVALAPADLDRVGQIMPHGSFGSRYPAERMPQW
jgi:aryl-alcohol dehydrogenase-like predicted oxidoreductase